MTVSRPFALFFQRGRLAALLLALLPAAGAWAANLQISPVMINFRGDQNATGINLQNLGEAPIFGQVRVYSWDQKDGEDVLLPTTEVVASPPIVQIAPKGGQTVRLVRTGARGEAGERTYRVLIDEVAREGEPAVSGVDIKLRYSVPVFVAPAAEGARESLSWTFFRKDGEWMLRVNNSGPLHAQIGAFSVTNAAGKEFVVSRGLFGYVLSGRVREWRLPLEKTAELDGVLQIKGLINARQQTASNQRSQ